MISITINYILLFEFIFCVKNNNVENFLDYFGKNAENFSTKALAINVVLFAL